MEHVPAPTAVMTNPATVQKLVVVDVNVTVRDDEAVGETVWVDPPTVIADGVAKVMDCVALVVAGKTAITSPEPAELVTEVAPATVKKFAATPVNV
jgi:hypothetical protein